jgi:hypothetical protein
VHEQGDRVGAVERLVVEWKRGGQGVADQTAIQFRVEAYRLGDHFH